MIPRRTLLGSGYFNLNPDVIDRFVDLWHQNIEDRVAHTLTRKVVISVGASWRKELNRPGVDVLELSGNCGHVHQLIGKQTPAKSHNYCGWSAAVLALAMIAYCDESDLLYFEQDCLAFGPWVQQAYADMAAGDMVFGPPMKTAPFMPCAQSVFLIRNSFLPTFVQAYIAEGTDANVKNLPEHKFNRLRARFGVHRIRHLTFGVDRERPLPYDAKVWYGQKFTELELAELQRRGMI